MKNMRNLKTYTIDRVFHQYWDEDKYCKYCKTVTVHEGQFHRQRSGEGIGCLSCQRCGMGKDWKEHD
ncbi:hypothetical protein AGMMS50239_24390 [Bacteroidia bacterium]|nr:hypothetical protein AGMMS50239_24390 [Bacteroidia bacterium]